MAYPLCHQHSFESKGVYYFVDVFVVREEPARYVFKVTGYDRNGFKVKLGQTTTVRSSFIRAFEESDRAIAKGFLAVEDWVMANW